MKISLFVTTVLTYFIFAFNTAKTPAKPNIIYVMADDLGYGDLSCYGQKKFQTPHLDRMAQEGIRYTDYHSGSTVCAPSRCALMTGKHMGHAYIRGNGEIPLRDADITVAEYLKQNGYYTGMFGKWGLGQANNTGSPEKQGWDEFLGYTHHVHAHHFFTNNLWTIKGKKTVIQPIDSLRHTHLYVMDAALNFVKNNQKKPFFMYLAVTMPHAEVFAPTAESVSPFLNDDKTSIFPETPFIQKAGNYRSQARPKANFAGMVTHLDRDMGRLMELLKSLDLAENTYVFFTSDNGPHQEGGADPVFFDSNGPLKGIKRDMYEGGIRVPLIAWGGKVKKGLTNNDVLANWDFFPTAAELASGSQTPNFDGLSFANTLLGKPLKKKHESLYWEFYERGFDQAIRMGEEWKAVKLSAKGGKLELYNLKKDIGEENDVAAQYPDIVAKAEKAFADNRVKSDMWPLKKG